jgi:hypothetical protein
MIKRSQLDWKIYSIVGSLQKVLCITLRSRLMLGKLNPDLQPRALKGTSQSQILLGYLASTPILFFLNYSEKQLGRFLRSPCLPWAQVICPDEHVQSSEGHCFVLSGHLQPGM